MKAEKAPLDGSSPISELPLELHSEFLSFLPLKKHMELRRLNKSWQTVWNHQMKLQMNSLGREKGIKPPITSDEGFETLWETQRREIKLLLKNEKEILQKSKNAQTVIAEFDKLKVAINQQPKSVILLHARDKILNSLNEAIISVRLEQCDSKNTKELDCVDCCLTRFPASVIEKDLTTWQNLIWLSLTENYLSTLPENIGLCVALTTLELDDNTLISLPESIGMCVALSELNANSNFLITLPEGIGKCQALAELSVSSNLLVSIPESIGQCKNLTKFFIDDNQLSNVPVTLSGCIALIELHIDNNQLTCLPNTIGSLVALKILAASNNCLGELPESLTECKAIKRLSVNNNCLKTISENLSETIFCDSDMLETKKSSVLATQKQMSALKDEEPEDGSSSMRKIKLK